MPLTVHLAREQRPEATDAAFSSNGNAADYKLVRQDIAELINVNPAKGPTLVRLAWHSSGTYSKILKDGGSSKGTIRFKEELQHGANAGLDTATMWLEPIYKKVRM
jgi:cytochrome c peroxidase